MSATNHTYISSIAALLLLAQTSYLKSAEADSLLKCAVVGLGAFFAYQCYYRFANHNTAAGSFDNHTAGSTPSAPATAGTPAVTPSVSGSTYESGAYEFNGSTAIPYTVSDTSPSASSTTTPSTTVEPESYLSVKNRINKLPKNQRLSAFFSYLSIEHGKAIAQQCDLAYEYFAQQKRDKHDIIVFDKDGTMAIAPQENLTLLERALLHNSFKECHCHPNKLHRQVVIKPVLALWKKLQTLGYQPAIITADAQRAQADQCTLLEQFGYTLPPKDLIFFASDEDRNNMISYTKLADYKLKHRKKLNKDKKIVGNVGDSETDFEGENNGRPVKLPHFIEFICAFLSAQQEATA